LGNGRRQAPGERFETAGLLGLTGDLNQGGSGIELLTNDDLGYYFYLKLGADTNLTFTFYTEQPVGDYQSRVKNKIVLMTLYDANKASRAVSTTAAVAPDYRKERGYLERKPKAWVTTCS
jgi:hypothetical protein